MPARFQANAGHFKPAGRMPADYGSGATTVNIYIADAKLLPGTSNVFRTS